MQAAIIGIMAEGAPALQRAASQQQQLQLLRKATPAMHGKVDDLLRQGVSLERAVAGIA